MYWKICRNVQFDMKHSDAEVKDKEKERSKSPEDDPEPTHRSDSVGMPETRLKINAKRSNELVKNRKGSYR